MSFSFDLISDIHAETWPDFDWTGRATSPYCVVAGDVARDRDTVSISCVILEPVIKQCFMLMAMMNIDTTMMI